jgi:hypothetical protein
MEEDASQARRIAAPNIQNSTWQVMLKHGMSF